MSRHTLVERSGPPIRTGLPATLSGLVPPPRRSGEELAMALDLDHLPPSGGAPRLNEGDRQLLRLLADGRSTGQIAAAMSVTSNTTRTRIRRVQRKLAVARRDQVVGAARLLGVL
jgi:DNA-binding CsgD family transcriptional regulator